MEDRIPRFSWQDANLVCNLDYCASDERKSGARCRRNSYLCQQRVKITQRRGMGCLLFTAHSVAVSSYSRRGREDFGLETQTTPRTLWRHPLVSADAPGFTSALKQVLHRLGSSVYKTKQTYGRVTYIFDYQFEKRVKKNRP